MFCPMIPIVVMGSQPSDRFKVLFLGCWSVSDRGSALLDQSGVDYCSIAERGRRTAQSREPRIEFDRITGTSSNRSNRASRLEAASSLGRERLAIPGGGGFLETAVSLVGSVRSTT
jgi:hypothetical protein